MRPSAILPGTDPLDNLASTPIPNSSISECARIWLTFVGTALVTAAGNARGQAHGIGRPTGSARALG
jgi:hypothetical protein